ncbi:MAG: hypothetical protein K0R70_1896, partial [Steroidobacteraceae bacterium]|nr:hypothetical protein [Steroidobacteraceae bacterium]
SAEALEDLLAPIALYPDPLLSQVLIASTNPQEVLDAGNWLIANEGLKGQALDDAAAKVGFTPPIRALVQFPQTVDMMCMEMGWTTELGEAFVADQAGVLDAVQRLRKQAMDVGNLKTSEAMVVEETEQDGEEVVVLKPPKPDVVYVPTYDPQAAYVPAPAAAAPAVTTTATPAATADDDDDGHSTGSMIATGVLAFGAGMLVNELLEDDDDDYYYPKYGYGGMPYYPPYPYRPAYGNGYYPSNGYNRPPNYNSGFVNTGTIVINNPGGGSGGYWNRYDDRGAASAGARQARTVLSPITTARPNRPELQQLNARQPRPMPADAQRPSTTATASNWKGQSSYAGKQNRPASASPDAATRLAQAQSGSSRAAAATRDGGRPAPKVQGSYAGKEKSSRPTPAARDAKPSTPRTREVAPPPVSTREVERPSASTREVERPSAGTREFGAAGGGGDRGYGSTTSRPRQTDDFSTSPQQHTAVSGANRGSHERAASQRGRQSMPQGARSKGGGGRER